MRPENVASGIQLARLLALTGAETAVRAPKDRLPFDDSGPASDTQRWSDLGRRMREHEAEVEPWASLFAEGCSASPLDYWLVMLCGAVERYPEAAVALGILNDAAHAHLVTPMAFAQLMHASRGIAVETALCGALGGGRPARIGLLEVLDSPSGRPRSHQLLRVSAAEIRALLDEDEAPDRMDLVAADVSTGLPAFDEDDVNIAAQMLDQCRVVALRGPSPRALRQFAIDLAGRFTLVPRWFQPDSEPQDMPPILRARDVLPILDLTRCGANPPAAILNRLVRARARVARLGVLAGEEMADLDLPSIFVPRIGRREAERVWRTATGDAAMARRLATRFRVNIDEAKAASRHASLTAPSRNGADAPSRERVIARHVLEEGARRMGRQVTHLRSSAQLDDLIVPRPLREQLQDIIDWHEHTARVFGEMGLGARTLLGRGLTCLFAGPPGTGKTFAAQCLANELGLNLYRIDLSQVVSKYIGETEKSLSIVFEEAESGHGVLLFDEADALFGKRSEVKDAHDRYANIEVGYLLQRIETYEGLAILATNLRSNMDAAFTRRLRFLLDFPMPDAAMRRRLWEQSMPGSEYRAHDVDLDVFASRFRLSGGSIQNVSLAAAHMAAATHEGVVTVEHLVRATYRELVKSGQHSERAGFGDLADYLPAEVL